ERNRKARASANDSSMWRVAASPITLGQSQWGLVADSTGSTEQQVRIVARQVLQQRTFVAEHRLDQLPLAFLQFEHPLFDRAATRHAIRVDGLLLANAMGAVDRLLFDRGIPPWVQQEHVVGRGQIETRAASLQADQEHRASRVVLELLDSLLALSGAAVKALEREAELG